MDTIPLSAVSVGNRARKDYGDLSGLKNSLSTLGSIHPLVLSKDADGTFSLVAGGRRFRAAQELGVEVLSHASVLEPGKIGFLFRDEVPEDVLREAELDENLYRLKPKWQEDVLLIADVHLLKRDKEGHKWGVRQTADLLGSGYGRTSVSYAVRIAKEIRAGNPLLLSCDNMSDAIAVMLKAKEDEALAEMQKRSLATGVISLVSSTDSFLPSLTDNKKVPLPDLAEIALSSPTENAPKVRIPLSSMFQNADFRDVLPKLPDASFNHVVTDIPYGIDMKNLDTRDMSSVADEHDVEQNISLMEPFLHESFRLVRSSGFCVFFYDLDHHDRLQTLARSIGWRVQRWPLIAYKTSACQNNAAQYNFTKNYESVMVLRRDEKTVLRSQQASSVWMGDFSAERRLYNNPFAKPFALWKFLFDAIAFPGQSVLDPFCGEMSSCRAAANCGLQPFGVELKAEHYARGLEHMKAMYALLHKSNVEFA